jgi:hypothetical protein
MKKLIVAGALALSLMASARQEASAWCRFNLNAGFNICYESTGCCWNWCFSCVPNPPPCGYGCYAGGYGASFGASAYPAYAYGYAPAAPAAAPAALTAQQPQTLQAGYTFYGNGNAPAYWYGQ